MPSPQTRDVKTSSVEEISQLVSIKGDILFPKVAV